MGRAEIANEIMPMKDLGKHWLEAVRRDQYGLSWSINDEVLATRDPRTRNDPRLPYHRRWVWDGRGYAGRDVLVRCYHGLGDVLQFARYLPVLHGVARHLTVEIQPALMPLLASVPGMGHLIPFDRAAPSPPAECEIEIMELCHALRLAPTEVPAAYLAVPAAPLGRRPSVGLCWRSGDWDKRRSIPLAELLACCDGLALVSLQRGPAAAEAVASSFLNPGDASLDILATAALIAAVDLVVTVDTMVAHLAGALGRPTCVLLRRDADWRWGEARATSWYPGMRLLRQEREGDWTAPLAELARLLSRLQAD